MLIIYPNDRSRIAGPDAAIAAIAAADFPKVKYRERDANSGELFIEFVNGLSLFIHNGERCPHTATYLDMGRNVDWWMDRERFALIERLREELRNCAATCEGKVSQHMEAIAARIARLSRK